MQGIMIPGLGGQEDFYREVSMSRLVELTPLLGRPKDLESNKSAGARSWREESQDVVLVQLVLPHLCFRIEMSNTNLTTALPSLQRISCSFSLGSICRPHRSLGQFIESKEGKILRPAYKWSVWSQWIQVNVFRSSTPCVETDTKKRRNMQIIYILKTTKVNWSKNTVEM